MVMKDIDVVKNAFDSIIVDGVLDVFLPKFLNTEDENIMPACAKEIAFAFEISKPFLEVLEDESQKAECDIIERWALNVHLLIDKTWVESHDEFFKAETIKSLDRMKEQYLLSLHETRKESYSSQFALFISLLKDIIYLLFGKEAKKDSLVEYVLRMEPHFGLFCYYINRLQEITNITEQKARLATLIAFVFLAEF